MSTPNANRRAGWLQRLVRRIIRRQAIAISACQPAANNQSGPNATNHCLSERQRAQLHRLVFSQIDIGRSRLGLWRWRFSGTLQRWHPDSSTAIGRWMQSARRLGLRLCPAPPSYRESSSGLHVPSHAGESKLHPGCACSLVEMLLRGAGGSAHTIDGGWLTKTYSPNIYVSVETDGIWALIEGTLL